MRKMFLVCFVLFAFVFSGFSQSVNEVKIGNVSNGVLTITNPEFLNVFFNNILNLNGNLGESFFIHYLDDGSVGGVSKKVTNNSTGIFSIAVTLVTSLNDVYVTTETSAIADGGGGSYEITCAGDGCSNCELQLKKNIRECWCKCLKVEKPEGYCNMTVTKTISIDISLPGKRK